MGKIGDRRLGMFTTLNYLYETVSLTFSEDRLWEGEPADLSHGLSIQRSHGAVPRKGAILRVAETALCHCGCS